LVDSAGRYDVREVGSAHLPALRAIATSYELLEHWPRRPDFLDCERELGRQLVALNGDSVVGFGGTFSRGTITHLADLFVARDSQSSGAGRALLGRLLAGSTNLVTFASSDRRALASYIRFGMVPRCPLYYLSGPARDAAGDPTAVEPSTMDDVVSGDAAASGGTRPELLDWYAGRPGVQAYTAADGYAVARVVADEVLIGPAGAGTPDGCARVVRAIAARYPDKRLRLLVFGIHPLLPELLNAGLRIEDADTFLASAPDLVPLDRYVPHGDLG
jgi:GNAT superfamily N-acetyltransferase